MTTLTSPYYSYDENALLASLETKPDGLSGEEAASRLKKFGFNKLNGEKNYSGIRIFVNQFKSALTIILIAAAILSFFLGERTDGLIILLIIMISAALGFLQERSAANAVKKLMEMVSIDARVIRDGKEIFIPIEQTVPGDITLLSAGDMVPGDCRLLDSRDLFCN